MIWALVGTVAGTLCPAPCDAGDIECLRAATECLVDAGRPREAVNLLKPLAPESAVVGRLLARAYEADGNPFWAERTLRALVAADETDCDSRAHLAWLLIRVGRLEDAPEVLTVGTCPGSEAEHGRWQLLNAYASHLAGDGTARQVALSRIQGVAAEDLALYRHLRARDPGWMEPARMRLEVVAGYTSNGLAGSASDSPAAGAANSGLLRLDGTTQMLFSLGIPSVRPSLGLGVKAHGLAAEGNVREQSYLELSVRPAVVVGRSLPRLTVAYSADLLLLDHGERGTFSEGHRGEVDVELSHWLTAFAGGGRRVFREGGRSRWEADAGAGISHTVSPRLHVLAVVAGRVYRSTDPTYHQSGATLAAVARVQPGLGSLVRATAAVGLDDFPDSGNRPVNERAFGTDVKRQDLLLRVAVGVWAPPLSGARLGVRYEYAWRNSTVDLAVGVDDYDYSEHRLLAGVRWTWDGELFGSPVVRGHVEPLPFPLDQDEGEQEERIRDLLRQEETARRGSTCVN